MMGILRIMFLLILLTTPAAGRNNDPLDTESSKLLHRQKRGLYPGNAEYEFFDNYFRDSGRGNECFRNSICHGRISDWREVFDVGHHVDYRGAMDRVRQFYVNEKYRGRNIDHVIYNIERIIQERAEAGRRHGGLDYRHRTVINGWQSLQNDLRSARFKRGVQFLLAPFAWFGGALGSSLFAFSGGVVPGSHCSMQC